MTSNTSVILNKIAFTLVNVGNSCGILTVYPLAQLAANFNFLSEQITDRTIFSYVIIICYLLARIVNVCLQIMHIMK